MQNSSFEFPLWHLSWVFNAMVLYLTTTTVHELTLGTVCEAELTDEDL